MQFPGREIGPQKFQRHADRLGVGVEHWAGPALPQRAGRVGLPVVSVIHGGDAC